MLVRKLAILALVVVALAALGGLANAENGTINPLQVKVRR